jgi:hypothetical protein
MSGGDGGGYGKLPPVDQDPLNEGAVIKNPNFLCGHRKGHSPSLTTIGSLYTLFFVVTSAHTLLGPFILLLRLVDHKLCLD